MTNSINLLKFIDELDSSTRFSEDAFYEYYKIGSKYKNIYEKIKILYETKWCLDRPFLIGLTATIEKWLANYNKQKEQKVAFEIIPKIIFYCKREMEILCDLAYKKLLMQVGKKISHKIDQSFINNHFILVPLTDSGAPWCRHLRHKWNLKSQIVKQSINDLQNSDFSEKKHIIFTEDFVGSGADAVSKYIHFRLAERKRERADLHFYYLTLIATEWGIKFIKTDTEFEIVTGEVLTSEYQCFSNDSIIFLDEKEKKEAKKIFEKYGLQLSVSDPQIKGFPLGFDNGQLLVVLYDNTPDNTLPVIWYPNKNWFPLFKRSRRR